MWLLKLLFLLLLYSLVAISEESIMLLIAVLTTGWMLWQGESRRRAKKTAHKSADGQWQPTALALFSDQLTRLQLPAEQHDRLTRALEAAREDLAQRLELSASERDTLREALWNWLRQHADGELGPPPWQVPDTETPPPAPPPAEASREQQAEPLRREQPRLAERRKQKHRHRQETPTPPPPKASTPATVPEQETQPEPTPASLPEASGEPTERVGPSPAESEKTGAWEKITQFLPGKSFFSDLLWPFLWQNIGWFIAGFLAVSGSIMLITETTGYYKALAILGVLSLYALLFIFGGYAFRRYRPELRLAADILSIIGLLLIPVVLSAAARVLALAWPHWLATGFSLALILVIWLGFGLAARLAAGSLARNLQGEHAWLFMLLAGLQLLAPVVEIWPLAGLLLPGAHLMLLGLLAWSLHRFAADWARQWFVDRAWLSAHAAGSLIFAATLSFVHLTWAGGQHLPEGYPGLFLMAVNGLLWQATGSLSFWREQYPRLERLDFLIYALLVPALLLSWQNDFMLGATLALGGLLYAAMLWHYLTLPPLYLAVGCLAGVYGLLILQPFPAAWHFLLGLPGLGALLALERLALRRRSAALARIAYRLLNGLVLLLVAWSLVHASPGWLGLFTALSASGLILLMLRDTAELPLAGALDAGRGYLFTALCVLSLAYAPIVLGDWREQFTLGLALLAAVWAWLGGRSVRSNHLPAEIWLNSSLAAMLSGLLLASPILWPILSAGLLKLLGLELLAGPSPLPPSAWWLLPPLLNGLTLLALGLKLRAEGLTGLGLFLLLAVPGLGKALYLPGLSPLAGLLGMGFGAWLVLRLSPNNPPPLATPGNPPRLLGMAFTPRAHPWLALRRPLLLLLWTLWALVLWRLALVFLEPHAQPNPAWPLLGHGLLTLLLAGQSRRAGLIPLTLLAWTAGLIFLLPMDFVWLPAQVAGYGLLLWLAGGFRPRWAEPLWDWLDWRGGWPAPGGRRRLEAWLLGGTFALQVGVWVVCLIYLWMPRPPEWPPLLALIFNAVFFGLAAWRYPREYLGYWLPLALGLGLLGLVSHLGDTHPWLLLSSHVLTPWLAAMGGLLALLAGWLDSAKWSGGLARIRIYRHPLRQLAVLLCGFALFDSLGGWMQTWPTTPWVSIWTLALLGVALMPLAGSGKRGDALRGLGLPLLWGGAWLGLWSAWLGGETGPWLGLISGAFLLWAGAVHGLPVWNQRRPAWKIAPEFWPALSLLCLFGGFLAASRLPNGEHWPLVINLSLLGVHAWLWWRVTRWFWLPAVGALALLLAGIWADYLILEIGPWSVLGLMLWLNLLLAAAAHFSGRGHSPWGAALFAWSALTLGGLSLGLLFVTLGQWPVAGGNVLPPAEIQWLSLLLPLSWWHLSVRLPMHDFPRHGLLGSLPPGLCLLAAAMSPAGWPLLAPTFALWSLALLALGVVSPRLDKITDFWLPGAMALSLFGLLQLDSPFHWQAVLIAGLLGGLALLRAWRQNDSHGWWSGLALLAISLHLAWPTAQGASLGLLPWLAWQNSLLAWGLRIAADFLGARDKPGALELRRAAEILIGLAFLAWLGQFWLFFLGQAPLLGPWGHAASLLGGALLLIWWWRDREDEDSRVYGAALILGLTALHLRLLWWGAQPLMAGDTVALLAAGYALLAAHYATRSRALYRLTLLLPVLALFSVPWQLGSSHASLSLLAAGSLYLLLPRRGGHLSIYLGLLAINLALYLWVPGLAQRWDLLQLYTVPAALTALLMLELHWLELRRSTRNTVRLIALGLLYVSATWDVFASPALSVFLLALTLGLLGVILGIALRIRAFLFTGTLFLMFNVISQLIQHAPEHNLIKALVLMGVGSVILAGMIAFSLQREAILRHWRIIRADLAEWD